MSSNLSGRYLLTALAALAAVLGVMGTAQAADANLYVQFTTTNPGGNYSGNVHVVWLTTTSGGFVATLGTTTTDNKRAVWANSQADELDEWYTANLPTADRTADIAARTGATQSSYQTYTFNWNWRDTDGATISDGTYQLHFLVTNSNTSTVRNHAVVNNVIKGTSAWSYGPTTQNGYNNISLNFTPAGLGVRALPATNVGSASATLNGEVTATDPGGSNPNVYIYYGDNDGGTVSSNWDYQINLGTSGVGSFSADVIDLTPATAYYYRCRVVTTSPAKDIWSGLMSFTTTQPEFAHINVIPQKLDFLNVPVNGFRDLDLRVQNSGRLPLQINTLEFVGLESDAYSLVPSPALPLVLDALSGLSWVNQDIGGVGIPGSVEYSGNTITINASGADIWGNSDEFHFLYLPLTGNGTITARVDSLENTDPWAKAGVMMRETLAAGSKNVFMALSYNDGATYQWRTSTNGTTSSLHDNPWGAPYWVRLVRSGNTFTAYRSPDGQTWTQWADPQTFAMNNTLYIGLAVTSHNDGTLCTAVFSNVSTSVPPPNPDEETLTVRFNPTSVQDYKYAKLAIGSNDPGQVAYVDLQGVGGSDAELGTRQVGGVGGPAKAVAKYDDDILLGQGAMLVLLDVSDPASPSRVNQIRLDGVIEAITVQGDAAYAALGNKGFAVVDLNTFTPLGGVETVETGGFAADIDSEGNFLCVADGIAGTHVYDISTPIEPALITTYATDGTVTSVDVSSGFLFILDESNGIQIIQLNPASTVDSYPSLEFGTGIKTNGTLIYAVDSFGNLSILDTAGGGIIPQSETMLQVGSNVDVEIQSGYAYVLGQAGLEVLDVSNPTSPGLSGIYETLTDPSDVVVDGTVAYVADGLGGLEVLDISNPAAIASRGRYSLLSASSGVASDSLGNVYSVGNQQNMADYDLSAPTAPAVNETYENLFHAVDIQIEGQYAYVAAGLAGLNVFDLSNPAAAPAAFATARFASAVSVNGSTAMVCDSHDVYVIDVSSPMSPSLIGSMSAAGWGSDVAVGSTHGYVAKGGRGIAVLDLSNAQEVGAYPVAGIAYGVAVVGDALYVACGTAGVTILDVSDPANPSWIAEYDLPGMTVDVAKVGDKLCAADAAYGISVLDISTPATPVLYAKAATRAPAFHVSSAGSRILVADRNGGLAVLGLTDWPKGPLLGNIAGGDSVGLDDLCMLAADWLDEEIDFAYHPGNIFYYDTVVNLSDLSMLSSHWQEYYHPSYQVGHWAFDEISGTIASDSSLNGHDGTLKNMDDGDWIIGAKANALSFDGVNDYVQVAHDDTLNPGSGSWSVAFWVRSDTANQGTQIITKRANAIPYIQYSVGLSAGNSYSWVAGRKLTFLFREAHGLQKGGCTTADIDISHWTHVCVVLDTGLDTVFVYINGTSVPLTFDHGDALPTINNTSPLYIGGNPSTSWYFRGQIDDVHAFNKALSEQEIKFLSQH